MDEQLSLDRLPDNVALLGVAGSTAYNMAHADSDIDYRGVFVASTWDILSLNSPKDSYASTHPDVSLHEVEKFMHLAMNANPTVLESLFYDTYIVKTDTGNALIEGRDLFLTQRIRNSHLGYARSQFKRLLNRGDSFSAQTKKRTEKHARHLIRLVLQAERALLTGEFRIRLTEKERDMVFEFGELPRDKMIEHAERKFDHLATIESALPYEPDYNVINDLLLSIRRDNL